VNNKLHLNFYLKLLNDLSRDFGSVNICDSAETDGVNAVAVEEQWNFERNMRFEVKKTRLKRYLQESKNRPVRRIIAVTDRAAPSNFLHRSEKLTSQNLW